MAVSKTSSHVVPRHARTVGGPQPSYATYMGEEQSPYVKHDLYGLRCIVQPKDGVTVLAQFILNAGTGLAVFWYELPEADFELDRPFDWGDDL